MLTENDITVMTLQKHRKKKKSDREDESLGTMPSSFYDIKMKLL